MLFWLTREGFVLDFSITLVLTGVNGPTCEVLTASVFKGWFIFILSLTIDVKFTEVLLLRFSCDIGWFIFPSYKNPGFNVLLTAGVVILGLLTFSFILLPSFSFFIISSNILTGILFFITSCNKDFCFSISWTVNKDLACLSDISELSNASWTSSGNVKSLNLLDIADWLLPIVFANSSCVILSKLKIVW